MKSAKLFRRGGFLVAHDAETDEFLGWAEKRSYEGFLRDRLVAEGYTLLETV